MRGPTQFIQLVLLCLLPVLGGCVLVTGPTLFERETGLRESVVDGQGDAKVLLLDISGFISDEPSDRAFGLVREQSMLARVQAELQKAEQDDAIKAIVLRIDSPGGGVTASDEIYHLLKHFRETQDLPLIASFGGLAASGAYYIGCSADHIVAHPTGVTGSIGVILVGLNVEGLMDKLGVKNQTYKTGPHKDLLSPLRGATPQEQRIVNQVLDDMYQRFVSVVESNRPNLADDQLQTITDGRIFTSEQARQLGLVDEIGRLDDAIERAKQRAGVQNARVIRYHRPGVAVETVYSEAQNGQFGAATPQVNILPIDLSLGAAATPQFMYLWRPGLNR